MQEAYRLLLSKYLLCFSVSRGEGEPTLAGGVPTPTLAGVPTLAERYLPWLGGGVRKDRGTPHQEGWGNLPVSAGR